MNTQVSPKKGVEFLLNSKKPFPDWLRNHTVFKEVNKIDKVFPKIGMPNFSAPADLMNNQEATADALRLGNKIKTELDSSTTKLYKLLDETLLSKEKNRDELCSSYQSLVNLINNVKYSLQYNDFVSVVDNKVVMRLRSDIFNGDKRPVFRKGEGVLRVINKLKDSLSAANITFPEVEQFQEFKDFSKNNIPKNKYNIIFSSTGEDGAWDISTISMRGIASCQTWTAPQSRGLIGSVASKFVGVIYLASDTDIPGYGSKMLRRCVVRFCIDGRTKKPALLLDNMYPACDADALKSFKQILKEKSGLDVIYTYERPIGIENYYLPDEPIRKFLKQGETPYMDFQIPVKEHLVTAKLTYPKSVTELTDNFRSTIGDKINTVALQRKELFCKVKEKFDTDKTAYDTAKELFQKEHASKNENERPAFEMQRPTMDAELADYGGGVVNLFKHCNKKQGYGAGKVFANAILNSFAVDNSAMVLSKEQFHRRFLLSFMKNSNKVKEEAWKQVSKGTWMKSFPRSSERFFNFIFNQVRTAVVEECKDLIKKSSN